MALQVFCDSLLLSSRCKIAISHGTEEETYLACENEHCNTVEEIITQHETHETHETHDTHENWEDGGSQLHKPYRIVHHIFQILCLSAFRKLSVCWKYLCKYAFRYVEMAYVQNCLHLSLHYAPPLEQSSHGRNQLLTVNSIMCIQTNYTVGS
jgi:hypothetical protein